jgi:hypothetical protein
VSYGCIVTVVLDDPGCETDDERPYMQWRIGNRYGEARSDLFVSLNAFVSNSGVEVATLGISWAGATTLEAQDAFKRLCFALGE